MAKFAETMRALHAELGALFVVVGGADEAALRLRLLRALRSPAWAAAMEDVGHAVAAGDVDAPSGGGANAHDGGASGPSRAEGATNDDPMRLANVLRRCDLFIGDDSFPMHMAAAVGTPVVAIFGPSNHLAWGPYVVPAANSGEGAADPHAVVVRRDDLVCSPCLYRGHALGLRDGCAPRPCLNELGAGAVIAAARRLLSRRPNARNLSGGV